MHRTSNGAECVLRSPRGCHYGRVTNEWWDLSDHFAEVTNNSSVLR
jgi:hypothetical protein